MKKIIIRLLLVCLLLNVLPFRIFADNTINYEYVDLGEDADFYIQENVIDNGNGLYTLEMQGAVYFDTRIFVKIVNDSLDVLYLGQVNLPPNGEFSRQFKFKNILGENVTVYRYFDFYKITDVDETKSQLISELNGYKASNDEVSIETFINKYGKFFDIDMEAYKDASDKSVIISHIISEDVSTPEKFVSVVSEVMYLALYNSTLNKSDFVDNYKSILSDDLREKYESVSPDYIGYFNDYLSDKPVSTKEMLEGYLAEAIKYAVANEVICEYKLASSKSEYISNSEVLLGIDLEKGFNGISDYEMLDKILNAYDVVSDIEEFEIIKENINEAIVIQKINESEPADIFSYLDKNIASIRLSDEEKELYDDNKKDGASIIKALKVGGFEDADTFISVLVEAVKPKKSPSSGGGGGGGGSAPKPIVNTQDKIVVSEEITDKPDSVIDVEENEMFTDLETVSWAKTAINYLASKNIINGRDYGIFAPNDNVSREEFVKMILLALDFELSYEPCGFEDVEEGQWYYPYICSAKKNGIVNGISDTEFGTGKYISRQDMAVILYNAMKVKGMAVVDNRNYKSFDDEAEVSSYATEAVKELFEMGCINGVGDEKFSPKTNSSRAMAAQMIYNVIIN